MYSAESVTKCHPDKICDQISDAIVDYCLQEDKESRVAVETTGGHGVVFLVGEVTTKALLSNWVVSNIAKETYRKLTGRHIKVISRITTQSPDIAQGVDTGGAGDQGVMVGYACNESPEHLPFELQLCRSMLEPFQDRDGKCQVVLDNDYRVQSVVLSVQGKEQHELEKYVRDMVIVPEHAKLFCNYTGAFLVGGFDADSGCTGRKIVVDAYGPRVAVGGGAFSGKDGTKVDRSGAYAARYIANNIMMHGLARHIKDVTVRLGYSIGHDQPIIAEAIVKSDQGIELIDCSKAIDLRPQAIIERFQLKNLPEGLSYQQIAGQGHFGFEAYPWEAIDKQFHL